MKPTQYLLVGYPYSGKSTLASELVKRLGFASINIDQLKFKQGYKDVGDDDVPDEVWDEIFEEADKLIAKHLNEGKNLANEYAWITRTWRERAKKVAKDAGFDTQIIYIRLPEETIRARWLENSKTKERFHWSKKEFEQILKDFEELTKEENFIVYDQTIPLDEWIQKNL